MTYGTGDLVVSPHDYESPLGRRNRLTRAGWKLVFRRVVTDFTNDAMVDRAAAMTYYTLLSVAPMLLAGYSIFSLLMPREEDAPDSLLAELIQTYVPAELQADALKLLLTIVGTPSQSTIALTVSVVISLLSASGYVRSFSRSANLIYGRTEGRPIAVTWATMWMVTLVLVVGAVVIVLGALLTDGIVGAVLGLMAVMQNLADPSKLGQGIAAAFTATIYGIASANLLFLPMAAKLKSVVGRRSGERELVIEGLIAIAQGENPRNIEARLAGFLH